jgi:hypothetical protein
VLSWSTAIFWLRGGQFRYRFGREKWQLTCRAHTRQIGYPKTSALSLLGHYIRIKLPVSVRIWSPILGSRASANIFRIVSRGIPGVGWGLLIYDGVRILVDIVEGDEKYRNCPLHSQQMMLYYFYQGIYMKQEGIPEE